MNGTNPLIGTRCPTCNAGIERNTVHDLKLASPLAWRLLGRVQVRCPTHSSTKCAWRGDLSEVSSHLTDSRSHGTRAAVMDDEGAEKGAKFPSTASMEADAATTGARNAEALKEQGNAKFQAGAFKEAIQLYPGRVGGGEAWARPTFASRRTTATALRRAARRAQGVRRGLSPAPPATRTKAHLRWSRLCASRATWRARAPPPRRSSSRATRTSRASPRRRRVCPCTRRRALRRCETATSSARPRRSAANAATPRAATIERASRDGRGDRDAPRTLSVIREDAGNVSAHARAHALCLSDDFDRGLKHLKEALRPTPTARRRAPFRAMKAGAAAGRSTLPRAPFEEARFFHRDARAGGRSEQIASVRGGREERGLAAAPAPVRGGAGGRDLAIKASEITSAHYAAGQAGRPAERGGGASGVPVANGPPTRPRGSTTRRRCSRCKPCRKYYEVLGASVLRCRDQAGVQGEACSGTDHSREHRRGKGAGGTQLQGAREALEIMEDPKGASSTTRGTTKRPSRGAEGRRAATALLGRARTRAGGEADAVDLFFDTQTA